MLAWLLHMFGWPRWLMNRCIIAVLISVIAALIVYGLTLIDLESMWNSLFYGEAVTEEDELHRLTGAL